MEACAGAAPGTVRFATGEFSRSRVAENGDGLERCVVDVFPRFEDADLVKIDIEGAEWALLADPRFRELRAPVVGLEYHAQGGAPADPAAAARTALEDAGYDVIDSPDPEEIPGFGMWWGLRRSRPARP